MGQFFKELEVSPVPGADKLWRVEKAFSWISQTTQRIRILKGFETDFASVPKFFWGILPATGTYSRAALTHDWLYQRGIVSRRQADLYLLEAMEDCGTRCFTRYLIYYHVRWWGWTHWRRYQKKFHKAKGHAKHDAE